MFSSMRGRHVRAAIPMLADAIPADLKQRDQWVCWSAVRRGDKVTKLPKNPRTGANASSTDPSTWSDFQTAVAACETRDYSGIGFVFAEDREFTGLDLDHILTDDGAGNLAIGDNRIRELVAAADTYTEVSPSGTGLHLFFRGSMPDGNGKHKRVREDGSCIELYDKARFFTVTGKVFGDVKPVRSNPDALRHIQEDWLMPGSRGNQAKQQPTSKRDASESDTDLIELMKASANGDRISRLLQGDTSDYGGDDSAASLALLNHLAFWCDLDRERMERIFRLSGIDADKLDSKRGDSTWLQQQIDVALRDFTGDTYHSGSADVTHSPVGEEVSKTARKQRGRFDHFQAAQILVSERGACFIDGAPAVCEHGRYRVGVREIESELVNMYPTSTRHNRAETLATLDFLAPHRKQSDTSLIAFENGILDPRTMVLHPFSDDLVIPNVIPHLWNPDAKCDAVDQAIRNMANGNPATFANLCEAAGIAMSRRIEPPYIFCLLGYGSNGKSLYFKMLTCLLGDQNISRLEPQDFGKRFQTASVMGKLANIYDDASSDRLDKETCAQLKNISNGSGTRSDVKGKDPIEFQPYATLLFSFNSFPTCADTTPGFMRRLVPLDFTATFAPGMANYDPHVLEKVTCEAAMQRFAVLAVMGLKRVIDRGEITGNPEADSIKSDIRTANDTVLQWLNSTGNSASDLTGRSSEDAFDMYESWCDLHHRQVRSQIGFSRTVCRELDLVTKSQRMPSGVWRKVYERKQV